MLLRATQIPATSSPKAFHGRSSELLSTLYDEALHHGSGPGGILGQAQYFPSIGWKLESVVDETEAGHSPVSLPTTQAAVGEL